MQNDMLLLNKIQDDFDEYYAAFYGDRYFKLKEKFLTHDESFTFVRFSAWGDQQSQNEFLNSHKKASLENFISDRGLCLPSSLIKTQMIRPKIHSASPFSDLYLMDPGSFIIGKSLNIQADDQVLDMCASPGGKSLILYEELLSSVLQGEKTLENLSGHFYGNDISQSRLDRLKKVFQEYVPIEFQSHVSFHLRDGNSYGIKFPNYFDKILLDAPCGSEEHLVNNPKELLKWTLKRVKMIPKIQYSLLCSGVLALKPGGTLIYSTCSIHPLENDGVIEKFLEKKGNNVTVMESDLEEIQWAEKTKYGYQFFPDETGFGPLYFCILKKKHNALES